MKKVLEFLGFIFLVCWFFLAHVSLNFLDSSPDISETSEDGQYRVIINDMYPVNPIGLYCILTTESPIYFTLYDAKQNYIGQSSPFFCYGRWATGYLLFPGEADKNSFVVVDIENNGELNISMKNKRWWSRLFSIFY